MTSVELGPFPGEAGHDQALTLDAADPLAGERDRFVIDDADLIYLDGNSLGRLPADVPTLIDDVVRRQWGTRLIRSWNEGWWELHTRLGDLLAPIVGASPGEIVLSDSTSVNLHKLAVAALRARPGRPVIVTDDLNFPGDRYVLAGAAELVGGRRMEVVPSPDRVHGPIDAIEARLDDDVALVSVSHTCFTSGYTYDLARLARAARAAGALFLVDLSHSVGAVEVDLDGWGVDLAVGCTYKYLNGGPGPPAFLYVRDDRLDTLVPPVTGWWGHADPFAFDPSFTPAPSIRAFHAGTTPILSLAAIEPGLRRVAEVGLPAIRAKSESLVAFLEDQTRIHLGALGVGWGSPTEPARRGAHGALGHADAWRITRALIEQAAVVPDFRAPDVVRLGLSPLTTSFVEVHTAVQRLRRVLERRIHEEYDDERPIVT